MSICRNCHRMHVQLEPKPSRGLRRKKTMKYYFITESNEDESNDEFLDLCSECSEYMFPSGDRKKPQLRHYWPSMVYSFLSLKNADGVATLSERERWELIPKPWKLWWHHMFTTYSLNDQSLFTDVTDDLAIVNNALNELEWLQLAKVMDTMMAYPGVRCPFGCSEFLHRVNFVPLDDFLWKASNYRMPYYAGGSKGRRWIDSMSPAFPSTATILEKFECRPSISRGLDGPMILCCRNHDSSTTDSYIHAPESPTGTLYTPNSNEFAPAVLRTRTLRNVKLNKYSDTYSTALLQGGYDGFDTAYVSTKIRGAKNDNLSLLRDALSMSGRDDVMNHVQSLSCDPDAENYIPENIIRAKVDHANRHFPTVDCHMPEMKASSFVPIETAISIQEATYSETSLELLVYENEHDYQGKSTMVDVPWPRRRLSVHPTDGWGDRFQRVNLDSFKMWLLLGITANLPEMWDALSKTVKDNRNWIGHWLTFISKRLAISCARPISKKVFPDLSNEQMNGMLPHPSSDGFTIDTLSYLKFLFAEIPKIAVVDQDHHHRAAGSDRDHPGRESGQDNIRDTTAASVVISDDIGMNLPNFELRSFVYGKPESRPSWSIYIRHKNQKWWMQNGHANHFVRITHAPDVRSIGLDYIKIAVYCEIMCKNSKSLIRRYMTSLGGQSTVFCGIHFYPLIINHSREIQSSACVCCGHDSGATILERCDCGLGSVYVCPEFKKCGIGVCRKHHQHAQDKCSSSLTDVIYLTKHGSRIGKDPSINPAERTANGRTVVRGSREAESLGPTAAHEIPQDLVRDILEENRGTDEISDSSSSDPESDSDSEGDTSCGHIVQSTVSQGGVSVEIDSGYRAYSTPLLVLLNQQGHLLTRQASKLRMRKKSAAFYQKITSKTRGRTIPLVYAEAMLFPDIFWHSLSDGTIPGAVPTSLWTNAATLRKVGVAPLIEQARARINNPATLCSTDPRFHFMEFDKYLNLGFRGTDTRLVLCRGFADRQGKDGVSFRSSSDCAELYGESSENVANVYKLCSLVGKRKPHYFYTQSCNQKTCRGLRVLRDWVSSFEAAELVKRKYGLTMEESACYLRLSAAPYILRSWNEVIDVWMKYIIYSKEAPLHEIEYAWYRKEFQEKNGNPSHIHCLLRTVIDISEKDGLDAVLAKIRGCLNDLIHQNEVEDMIGKGFISSSEHLQDILNHALVYLTHRCSERCQVPKLGANGKTTVYFCKAPDNATNSYSPHAHTLKELKADHTFEAVEILKDLGMMEPSIRNPGTCEIVEPSLIHSKHIPICSRNNPKFSPTNGLLFSLYPSSQNIQYCTGRTLCAYLTKYVSGIDEVALIRFAKDRSSEDNTTSGKYESLKNTKISGNAIGAKRKREEIRSSGRVLTHMECLSVITDTTLVTTTERFIHLPTSPREYRPAIFTRHVTSGATPEDAIAVRAVIGQTIRLGVPNGMSPCRLFSSDQMKVIQDEIISPLSTDAITIFSMRPPELRFVDNPRFYFTCFDRISVVPLYGVEKVFDYYRKFFHRDIFASQWLDGFNNKVVLRRGAIEMCYRLALDSPADSFGTGVTTARQERDMKIKICQLFRLIYTRHKQVDLRQHERRQAALPGLLAEHEQLSERFLCPASKSKLPTVWWTPVVPVNDGRFLVHLLLLFGRFETEYGLMKTGSMLQAFVKAKLFDLQMPPKHSLATLLRKYVLDCLAIQPGGIFQFDRNLTDAHGILERLMVADNVPTPDLNGTPPVLYTKMKETTNREVTDFLRTTKTTLVETLVNDLRHQCGFPDEILPSVDNIMKGEVRTFNFFPPPWNPSKQSEISYTEQSAILREAAANIGLYRQQKRPRNLVISGGPGNGKTTVSQLITLYALSVGLFALPTSILADRSKQIGGIHIHALCSLSGNDRNLSPGQAAQKAIASLFRKPHLIQLWRRIDVLFIDEFGLLNAELLATIDIVARYVRSSGRFLGGILCFATVDILQLLPFRGTPLLLSMNMLTDFRFLELNESVRAANDQNLRRLCQLTRTSQWTDQLENEFMNLVSQHCSFVESFDDSCIPQDAVFVFGRKAPCRKIEDTILSKLQRESQGSVIFSKSCDEESTTASDWKSAGIAVSNKLSQKTKWQRNLSLFNKGRYEFIYNLKGRFQQGQLALLLEVDRNAIVEKRSIAVYAAPPGCRSFPPLDDCTSSYLEQNNWTKIQVPQSTSPNQEVAKGVIGRRTQYGIRLRVASTIHSSMGSTLPALVTCITTSPSDPELNYTLWQAAQVVVLLSRTKACKDIYFVGNRNVVPNELLRVLKVPDPFLPHIRDLVSKLCDQNGETPILPSGLTYRPCDIVLPETSAVYALVSTNACEYYYIGETKDIRNRLQQHNTGNGTKYTNNPSLRPWAMLGYVYGFDNRPERQSFEQIWKIRARGGRNRRQAATAGGIIDLARTIATDLNARRHHKLMVVQCGSLEMSPGTSTMVESSADPIP